MELNPLDKLVFTVKSERKNGRVIGIKNESDGTKNYLIQEVRVDFKPHISGGKLHLINSKDIETRKIFVERHTPST